MLDGLDVVNWLGPLVRGGVAGGLTGWLPVPLGSFWMGEFSFF